MNLADYLKTLPHGGGSALARALNTSHVYLCQLASGKRRPSPTLAVAIEHATAGQVSARELRPDLTALFGGVHQPIEAEQQALSAGQVA